MRILITVVAMLAAVATASAQSDDFADGLTGGPDFWRVVGVPQGDVLNIRRAPAASARILGRARNGTVLRNGGCRMNGKTRWCRVTTRDGRVTGWAAGRFLRE